MIGSIPASNSLCLTVGSATAFAYSALSLALISFGVPVGTTSPCQAPKASSTFAVTAFSATVTDRPTSPSAADYSAYRCPLSRNRTRSKTTAIATSDSPASHCGTARAVAAVTWCVSRPSRPVYCRAPLRWIAPDAPVPPHRSIGRASASCNYTGWLCLALSVATPFLVSRPSPATETKSELRSNTTASAQSLRAHTNSLHCARLTHPLRSPRIDTAAR